MLLWASVAGDGVPSGAAVLFATPLFAEPAPPRPTPPPHTNVAVWLPALVLAGERLLAAPGAASIALLAALVGIQFTGGHIETSVDVLFCLSVYYGLRWWQVGGRRLGRLLLPALAIALGAALAAVQVV